MTDAASDRENEATFSMLHFHEPEIPVLRDKDGRCFVCRVAVLTADRDRLLRGEFTEEEFQNLCHNLSEDDAERFCNGCDEYQRKLFGKCRSDRLAEELDLWKPMTEAEALKALAEAEAIPVPAEIIQVMVQRAMDPADRLTNSEQAQLAMANKRLAEENARLREALRPEIFEYLEVLEEIAKRPTDGLNSTGCDILAKYLRRLTDAYRNNESGATP